MTHSVDVIRTVMLKKCGDRRRCSFPLVTYCDLVMVQRRFFAKQADEPNTIHASTRLRSLQSRRPNRRSVYSDQRDRPFHVSDALAKPTAV